jgi:hypothetical protein
MQRTEKMKALVFCSLPFQGTWSSTGAPDITLPPDFKAAIGHLDKGSDE